MSTLSGAQAQALADSYSKGLIDVQSALVAAPASTVNAIITGLSTATPSAMGRILSLLDAGLELTLLTPAATVANSVGASLTASTTLVTYYPYLAPIMNGLETASGGFAALLSGASVQVHQYFAAAFNYYAANAQSLGLRSPTSVVTPIPATSIFTAANVLLGTYTVGSGFVPGPGIDGTQLAPAPIDYQVVSASGSASTLQLTYVPSQSSPTTTSTFTPTIGGPYPMGLVQVHSITGLSIGSIAVTAGGSDTGAIYAFYGVPARSIATY